MDLIELSQKLLSASKKNQDVSLFLTQLNNISIDQLLISLKTDDQKKTFWINIYNAFVTILLSPNPELILNPIKRKFFFNKKCIAIAHHQFSLNKIEHGILRKSQIWWGKGYLKKWFVSPLENQLRLEKLDPRIHFALNCGSMGCPPINFYNVKNIEHQLNIATEAFLFSEVVKNEKNNSVSISKLFNWYIGDFGGKAGILAFLKKYNSISSLHNPTITYNSYNWNPWLEN